MSELPGYPSRRSILKGTAAGIALAASMPLPVVAQESPVPIQLSDYKPVFFNAEEWAFILAATARLIPSEGKGPGAIECRVPVFIDRQLNDYYGRGDIWYMDGPHDAKAGADRGWQTPLNPAQLYREGIVAFNAACELKYGKAFVVLDPADQDSALNALQKGEIKLQAELSLFFTTLLANTKEGYFADPIHGGNYGMQSWVYIGFPGARAAFKEWPTRHDIKYPLGPVSISGERA
ncbi:gluconate 2-dehydrogenase [Brucella pseudogrignonensis]|uniref:gluconate 2-dehydrogenase subunit 3 family protein n=1 Tax=Brucella pseudogrignonensis TaxID=419475 RepID=UPI0007DA8F20|nr:gluconate 2-dehydrogenase subunit 3 family protein [Brucella pseudogrignonensis]ANG98739.1 gluconate 2-dehydrogenase [Brucella pseudogrignonensis]